MALCPRILPVAMLVNPGALISHRFHPGRSPGSWQSTASSVPGSARNIMRHVLPEQPFVGAGQVGVRTGAGPVSTPPRHRLPAASAR